MHQQVPVPTHRTPYAEADELLQRLLSGMQRILGARLAGLYLYGSLVTGDFDPQRSDIDLLAATTVDVTDQEFERLQQFHDAFYAEHPDWDGPIEVAYLSVAGLQTFKTQTGRMAVMSPGEPFHLKQAGRDYLINGHLAFRRRYPLHKAAPNS